MVDDTNTTQVPVLWKGLPAMGWMGVRIEVVDDEWLVGWLMSIFNVPGVLFTRIKTMRNLWLHCIFMHMHMQGSTGQGM